MLFEDLDFENAVRRLRCKDAWNLNEIKVILNFNNDLDVIKILLYMNDIGLIMNDASKISFHPHALIKMLWSENAKYIITTKIHKKDGVK